MLESAGGIWGRAFSKEAYFPSRLRRRIQYSRFLTVRVVFLTDIAMSKRGLLWATFAMSVRRDRPPPARMEMLRTPAIFRDFNITNVIIRRFHDNFPMKVTGSPMGPMGLCRECASTPHASSGPVTWYFSRDICVSCSHPHKHGNGGRIRRETVVIHSACCQTLLGQPRRTRLHPRIGIDLDFYLVGSFQA